MNTHPQTCLTIYCIILKLFFFLMTLYITHSISLSLSLSLFRWHTHTHTHKHTHTHTHTFFTWWHQLLIINFNDHQYTIIHWSMRTPTFAQQQAPQILESNYSLHFVYYLLREARDCVCLCVLVCVFAWVCVCLCVWFWSALWFYPPIQYWHLSLSCFQPYH